MSAALRLVYRIFSDAFINFGELLTFNLLWFIFTLLIVTAPPAAAGLYYATNQLAHEQPVSWRTFFEGFRQHFWLGWRWSLLNVGAAALLWVNLLFYGQMEADWALYVMGAFMSAGLMWVMLQLFVFPLLLEQTDRRLRVALRNSMVLYLRRPLLSLVLLIVVAALVALSTWGLPVVWVILTGSLCAYLSNRGTLHVLEELRGGAPPARAE